MKIRISKPILFAVLLALSSMAYSEEETAEKTFLVDVTPGFPPFDNVDDPHPAEYHTIEANVFAQGDYLSVSKNTIDAPYFDLNYGALKNVQLKWEGWYVFQHNDQGATNDERNGDGFGNNLIGVKWMFLDGESSKLDGILKDVSAAVYPQLQFAPSGRSVDQGLAEGGKIYILPLLISKNFDVDGRPFAVTVNVGYNHGTGVQPDSLNEGVALGAAVAPRTSMMVSASSQQFNNHWLSKGHSRGALKPVKKSA